jgi:hypothetical protein
MHLNTVSEYERGSPWPARFTAILDYLTSLVNSYCDLANQITYDELVFRIIGEKIHAALLRML